MQAGIALRIQPNDAQNERTLACFGDFEDKTLWKYTCIKKLIKNLKNLYR